MGRSRETVKSFSVNSDCGALLFDFNAQRAKAAYCSQAVRAREKIVNFCSAVGNGAEHNASVGDGFVPRDRYGSFQSSNAA